MIRIGIIGCGYWGAKILRNLVDNGRCEVVAVADHNADLLSALAAEHPLAAVEPEGRRILDIDGIDAVVIATPPTSHAELALLALTHDKHVLVEKPMAIREADAHRLIRSARSHGRVLMVDHTFLYTRSVEELRCLVAAGALGTPVSVRAERRNCTGPRHPSHLLWDLSLHDVAILDHVLGKEPSEVRATRRLHGSREQEVSLRLYYGDGVTAELVASWFSSRRVRSLELVCSRGRVKYDGSTPSGTLWVSPDDPSGTRPAEYKGQSRQQREPLRELVEHFLDCVQQRTNPRTDGASGVRVTRVLAAGLRALSAGTRCTLHPPGSRDQTPPWDPGAR